MRTYKDISEFELWSAEDKDLFLVNVIKGLVMDGVRNANSGHTGGAMSSADFATILFTEFLKIDPDDPNWKDRDRFVLSAGHESMLLYSLLTLTGWLGVDDLKSFRQLQSRTPGHPEVEIPGVEATTGPLGQGVGMAVGMALAESMLRYRMDFSGEMGSLIDHFTYVIAGDGDLQEPVALGVAAIAGHLGLSRLVLYYDSNEKQISGHTNRSDSTNIATVFDGFGWHVQEIDGHDHEKIRDAIQKAQVIDRPSIIIGKTIMAHGSAGLEGDHNTHGSPMPQDEIDATKEKMGLAPEQFYLPDEAVNHFQTRFGELRESVGRWKDQLNWAKTDAVIAKRWAQVMENGPQELVYPNFDDGTSSATRKTFGTVLEKFAEQLPHLVGGSADLEPSNYTGGFAKKWGDFNKSNRKGRNIAFGVREFPMGTIMNGMALHGGAIPFGGTFAVFSDYVRPAIRLSALQKLPVIYEFTHDSFYVGEDGPTHQPVEHIMALRTIPNLYIFRPADPKETAVCFKLAVESKSTPSALLLSRQGLPVLPFDIEKIESGVRKGAYSVLDCDGNPEIVMVATGSEVSLAMDVAEKMTDKRVRVVSMPSMEIFDAQPMEYRGELIPMRGCLTVSIEAGITRGWEKYTGLNGINIGLNRFGASAPAGDLAEEFGFTAEKVIDRVRQHLSNLR
ncbi:MAG: transketolase [Candidatus Marinimicrobia bacterium]|nr:transketolase [Candidatus Neomarinimicrobiota bacterium]